MMVHQTMPQHPWCEVLNSKLLCKVESSLAAMEFHTFFLTMRGKQVSWHAICIRPHCCNMGNHWRRSRNPFNVDKHWCSVRLLQWAVLTYSSEGCTLIWKDSFSSDPTGVRNFFLKDDKIVDNCVWWAVNKTIYKRKNFQSPTYITFSSYESVFAFLVFIEPHSIINLVAKGKCSVTFQGQIRKKEKSLTWGNLFPSGSLPPACLLSFSG